MPLITGRGTLQGELNRKPVKEFVNLLNAYGIHSIM